MPHDSHWQHWHDQYSEAENPLNRRLGLVQGHIAAWLANGAAEPRRVVSACAGDGRDVLGVLAQQTGRAQAPVEVVLVELDEVLAKAATQRAVDAGLDHVEVRQADAGLASSYQGAVPADLLLLCGIFGNISDDDVRRTVAAVPQLVNRHGTVIWTRSRRAPDLTPRIRHWLSLAGCEEVAFNAPGGELFSVGVHRYCGETAPLNADTVLFRFLTDHAAGAGLFT